MTTVIGSAPSPLDAVGAVLDAPVVEGAVLDGPDVDGPDVDGEVGAGVAAAAGNGATRAMDSAVVAIRGAPRLLMGASSGGVGE
jgi:hypothetical protein